VAPLRYLVAEVGPVAVGFDLADITEVAPLERAVGVPWAPPCVVGAVEHQGRLTTLVDLGALLSISAAAAPKVAVFIDRPDTPVALCVHAVHIVEAKDAVQTLATTSATPLASSRTLTQAGWTIEALTTPKLAFESVDLDRVLAAIDAAFRRRA
jgi:chemotaxis signal transduction protein